MSQSIGLEPAQAYSTWDVIADALTWQAPPPRRSSALFVQQRRIRIPVAACGAGTGELLIDHQHVSNSGPQSATVWKPSICSDVVRAFGPGAARAARLRRDELLNDVVQVTLRVRIHVASLDPTSGGTRTEVARYGKSFKAGAVARLSPPESAALDDAARAFGIAPATLQRWSEELQSTPARMQAWTAGSRFDAVVATAPMPEAGKSAWCREHGMFPAELDQWRASATAAMAAPGEGRVSPQASRQDRLRIKELERELLRKDRALVETAALLVLSKSRGDLPQGRGRMIVLEDRRTLARGIEVAHSAGARLRLACETAASTAAPCSAGKPRMALPPALRWLERSAGIRAG